MEEGVAQNPSFTSAEEGMERNLILKRLTSMNNDPLIGKYLIRV